MILCSPSPGTYIVSSKQSPSQQSHRHGGAIETCARSKCSMAIVSAGGTEPSESMTCMPCQPGSVESFLLMKARRKSARLSMNGVPGVIVFESKA